MIPLENPNGINCPEICEFLGPLACGPEIRINKFQGWKIQPIVANHHNSITKTETPGFI